MAAETANTYISVTTTDRIEIPRANLGFTTMESSKTSGMYSYNTKRLDVGLGWVQLNCFAFRAKKAMEVDIICLSLKPV